MYETKPSFGPGPTFAFEADRYSTTAPARKRPLRTYGRRSIAAAQDAGPRAPSPKCESVTAEQTILSPVSKQGDDSETIVVALDDCKSPSPQEPRECPKPNRNSILSYFKPVAALPPSPSTLSDITAKESNKPSEEPSAPPPSPGPTSIPRKRRRLTTRPDIIHQADLKQGTKPPPDEEGDAPSGKENKKRKLHDISPKGAHGAPFIAVTTPPDIRLQRSSANSSSESEEQEQDLDYYPRAQAGENHLNQLGQKSPPSDEDNKSGRRYSSLGGSDQKNTNNKKKKKSKELVQTTLSLTKNPGPGFTICKDCGILYNHLNENDRKEHKRRHAAYVRSKAKRAL